VAPARRCAKGRVLTTLQYSKGSKKQYAGGYLRQIRTRRPADTSTCPFGPQPCGAVVRSAPTLAVRHTYLYGKHTVKRVRLLGCRGFSLCQSIDQPRPISQLGGCGRPKRAWFRHEHTPPEVHKQRRRWTALLADSVFQGSMNADVLHACAVVTSLHHRQSLACVDPAEPTQPLRMSMRLA
jgi:hypothetical protein